MSRAVLDDHRRVWQRKPVLQVIYRVWFDTLAAQVPAGGRAVEIGAGPGFLRAHVRDHRPDALWVRVRGRGAWSLAQPPDGWTSLPVPDGVVFRIAGSDPIDVQLAAPDGTAWPAEPVRLAPPVHPALAWWDV